MSPTTALESPYPGLRPFDQSESHLFFGRDEQTNEILRRLGAHRFVAVVGTSGCGKSSLVKAGVLPALHAGRLAPQGSQWLIATMRPGNQPIRNLAEALSQAGAVAPVESLSNIGEIDLTEAVLRRSSLGLVQSTQDALRHRESHDQFSLLVLVDQFEELFRYDRETSGGEATAFVQLLLEAGRDAGVPVHVAITMRSDFFGDCAQFSGLPEQINECQYLVPRMNRLERRAAITGPAEVFGAEISHRLLNRLINDVGDDPDQLPVLQHALSMTWRNWAGTESGLIDLEHYEAIGGLQHALSMHADEAFAELKSVGPDAQRQAGVLFKCITEKGPDNRGIRRPLQLERIAKIAEVDWTEMAKVVEVFRRPDRSFLMPSSERELQPNSPIDISHESLMRKWDRLKAWVEIEATHAQLFVRFSETVRLFDNNYSLAVLSRGELSTALRWQSEQRPNRAWASLYGDDFNSVMQLIDWSEYSYRREDEKRLRLQEETIRAARRFARHSLCAAVLLLLLLASVGWLTVRISKEKATVITEQEKAQVLFEEQRTILAQNNQLLQHSREEEGKAWLERAVSYQQTDPFAAAIMAGRAIGFAQFGREKLDPEIHQTFLLENADFLSNQAARVRQAHELVESRMLPRQIWQSPISLRNKATNIVVFSPDGRHIAAGESGGKLRMWDVRDGIQAFELRGHRDSIKSVGFSPDGRTIASGGRDGTLRVWSVQKQSEIVSLEAHLHGVNAVAFSANGRRIISAGQDATLKLWGRRESVARYSPTRA